MNTIDQRQRYIIEQIEKTGSVNVIQLARAMDVSEMTIRRDLNELERIGLVRRIHGGAVSARGRSYEPPLTLRTMQNRPVKQMLGKYASEMVVEGDCIAFDVGSTTYEVAANLMNIHNITIITPSIPIAQLFFDRSDVRLIMPGGVVRPGETSMVGDLARRNLELLFYDRLFLGVGALDSNAGLTEYNMEDAEVKKVMIKNAKEIILVADASKFEKIAFTFVAPLKILHHFITNEEPPKALLLALKNSNVTIHVVMESGDFTII
jgi:DeoR/GlpR family transcriptional regulator of sugar metabolism